MTSEAEIWPLVLDTLDKLIDKKITFDLWFRDMKLQKLIGTEAYLETPNNYKKEMIMRKYFDVLKIVNEK